MRRALTAAEMREVDQAAQEHGMPAALLMEQAGVALADKALSLAGPHGRFVVMCGAGNNGGDGLVAARRLFTQGRKVLVELIGSAERLEGEPQRYYRALAATGVTPKPIPSGEELKPGDVVVDALLGTGLNRAPEERYAEAIARIAAWRAAGAKVVSADVPSGLSSDSGQPFAHCVRADATVAFGYLKVGQTLEPGVSLCGELVEANIGIHSRALDGLKGGPSVFLLEESDAKSRLPERSADSHKGTYGHVLVVAGSWGKSGAAALTGLGALTAGAGRVTIATRPETLVPALGHAPELMGLELPAEGELGLQDLNLLLECAEDKQALVIGPGIPRGEDTGKLIGALLEELKIPCLIDADALNALAGNLEVLNNAKSDLLLTPHPGEMARLLGKTTEEVQKDRVGAARALATAHHVVVVLKGARTLIALDDGTVYVNSTGNPGMASPGTGDVLSGVCGALLGQGLSPEDAAVVGVYAHGFAGDRAVQRTGQLGMRATDLLSGLGDVWVRWGR